MLSIATYYTSFNKTRWVWLIFLFLLLAVSTKILPVTLVEKYEARTAICNPAELDKDKTYYLHILGAGYTLDPKLVATSQLSIYTLPRLVEAVRIANILPNYKIITSGNCTSGLESQASVVARAAIELGIPPENCEILESPANTAEEISEFVKRYGIKKNVIVVSDAIHLPRAMMLYKRAGMNVIGAPTNFKVKIVPDETSRFSLPSLRSIDLMNEYLREKLKFWKDQLNY